MKIWQDILLKLLMEIYDRFRKLSIYQSYKTYRGKNCFFTTSQYTEIPVISPTPNMNISLQPAATWLMTDIKHKPDRVLVDA